MEDGGCLGTTTPEWVFGTMLTAGACCGVAAIMFVVLMARPNVSDWSWRTGLPLAALYLLNTGYFLYGEYAFHGGWDGLLRGIGTVLGWWLLVSPVVVLVLRRRWLARRGLRMVGGWRLALTAARRVTAAVTMVSGTLASMMIWAQVLSLRPC
ncbi:hypothetical protein ACOCJ5_00650 [Knoellia sp. CPCC 206450]|uniref:hypothetical protein n=1 Tax=Knoellia tibetensis TaxID=3404798 RepID=UPI003B431F91